MALSEEQIVRYSRQILLKDVGGTGQERLLASPVQVRGSSAAVVDAAAYLSAGGCAASTALGSGEVEGRQGSIAEWPEMPSGDGAWVLIQPPRLLARSAKGCARCFELTARGTQNALGRTERSEAESKFSASSPEAGLLNVRPLRSEAESKSCALSPEAELLNVRPERSEAESKPHARPPSPEEGLLGTTAALLYQRAVLELGEPLLGLRVLSSGAWEPLPIERCEGCR